MQTTWNITVKFQGSSSKTEGRDRILVPFKNPEIKDSTVS